MSLNFIKESTTIGADKITDKTFTFFKQGFRLNGAIGEPEYRDVTVSGVDVLNLPNAKVDGLNYCKLYGKCDEYSDEYLGTVTLEGKCEQRNLPEGYTEVEYLQSSGTQWINTGYKPNSNIKFEISGTQSNTDSALFGISEVFFCFDNGNATYYNFLGGSVSSFSSTLKNVPVVLTMSASDGIVINGTKYKSLTAGSATANYSMALFGRRNNGTGAIEKLGSHIIKYAKIYESNILIHNYIPCRRYDSVLGMYDTVTGDFLTNAGTGTFTAGANVVPNPTNPVNIVCNNGVVKVSPNLFNKNTITSGYSITANGTITQVENFGYTSLIAIQQTSYTLSNLTFQQVNWTLRVHGYDSNGNWIQQVTEQLISSGDIKKITFTISNSSIKYLRLSIGIVNRQNIDVLQLEQGSTPTTYMPYKQVYTDGTTETVKDSLNNTATAEMLLAIDNYKDVQEVLSGDVTKSVKILVLDGTEAWALYAGTRFYMLIKDMETFEVRKGPLLCSHYYVVSDGRPIGEVPDNSIYTANNPDKIFVQTSAYDNVNDFKAFLASQYNAGTPVIVVYPLATPTTSTVTAQFLSKAPVTQTAGSISGMSITTTDTRKTIPTPMQPLDIICNNGIVKVSPNLFDKNNYIKATIDTNGTITQNNDNNLYIMNVYPNNSYIFSYTPITAMSGNCLYGYTKELPTIGGTSTYNIITIGAIRNRVFTVPDGYHYLVIRLNSTTFVPNMINIQLEQGTTATTYKPYKQIYTDGTVETVTDSLNNTATAQNLLSVGTYKDEQEVLSGNVTKNVGIKVLTGSETWITAEQASGRYRYKTRLIDAVASMYASYSNYFLGGKTITEINADTTITEVCTLYQRDLFIYTKTFATDTDLTTWLANQYANGTPVIVIYPLATPTTSTVTAQTLTTKEGTNTIEITQASLTDLPIEVNYKAGVTVTITQIENANLDNSVTVTIGE